jgi:hypothetical protein
MGRIAILDRFEYEYEYRDAEYEYEKKADRRRRADAIRLQDAIWGDPDDQCTQATGNGWTIEKNAMARMMAMIWLTPGWLSSCSCSAQRCS